MFRLLIAMGLMAVSCLAAGGETNEAHPVQFHLSPRAPVVRSLKELSFEFYQTYNNSGTLIVHTAEWELRDDYRHRRVARIPIQEYFYEGVKDERSPHAEGSRNDFSADDLRHIGPIEPGNYRMALLIDGKRASNVMAFQIDPSFDPAKASVLTVGMEEAPPGVASGSLVVWIIGPNSFDPQFTNMSVAFADISVDGVAHKPDVMAWTGPVGPYSVGDLDVRPFDTPYRLKGVDVSKPHEYAVTVGSHSSVAVKLNLSSHDLANEWDATTATMAALPAPKVLLAGVVHDEQGNPAVGYEVHLSRVDLDSPVGTEVTNDKGEYGFSGIEPGTYTVMATPAGKGAPMCWLAKVTVVADYTRHVPLSFESTYGVSGHVTDSQGKGLKGVLVGATWKEPESGAKCDTRATTKADGSYEVRGPFPSITDVGLFDVMTEPHYDVKIGTTDVDFVVVGK